MNAGITFTAVSPCNEARASYRTWTVLGDTAGLAVIAWGVFKHRGGTPSPTRPVPAGAPPCAGTYRLAAALFLARSILASTKACASPLYGRSRETVNCTSGRTMEFHQKAWSRQKA